MAMIEQERAGDVEIWRFAHGKVNALDVELLTAFEQALAAAERAPARAYVWTAAGSVFSAGVDLFRVLQGGAEYVRVFLPLLSAAVRHAVAFPHPVVAAVNGHAIAGGCVLACAADRRLAAAGPARIGVPELHVGVPFPPIVIELIRFATGGRTVQEVVLGGGTWPPEEALERGLVDRVVPAGDLLPAALAEAGAMAAIPAPAFTLAKQQLRRPALEKAERCERESGAAILEQWCAAETHAVIRAYLDRTIGRRG